MKLATLTLVLSLMAFASLGPANAQDWDKFIKCAKVGSRALAGALRASVPEVRVFLTCIDYTPPPNPSGSYLGCIKIIYEFLKRSIFDKSDCILAPLKKGVTFLKPHVDQIDSLKCFDQ